MQSISSPLGGFKLWVLVGQDDCKVVLGGRSVRLYAGMMGGMVDVSCD